MRVLVRLMRAAVGLIFICSTVLVALTQQPSSESGRIDRLVGLARLWAAVKYFHPYLAYRDDIDWDAALIKAIPKVDGARTPEEYSAAIAGMLTELGDPATHVLTAPSKAAGENSTPPEEQQPTFRKNADGILIVTMTNYSAFQDFVGTREKLGAIKKQLPTATGVVFDLRPTRTPSESEQGMAAYGLSESGLPEILTSVSLDLPGERRRMHIGYPSAARHNQWGLQLRFLSERPSDGQTRIWCKRCPGCFSDWSLRGLSGHGAWPPSCG